ncbi:18291_t:CDS:2, partial [Entrophospora sp. SA101]
DYDFELLQRRLAQLKKARKTGDLSQMIFLLRTSLARNLGDMGQPELYAHTHIGTKRLIEAYINEVVKQMNIICDTESDEISTKAKLEFFTNTRQSFGRTALLLSGGATFGLIHTGVIKSLYECKLLPRIISGAS